MKLLLYIGMALTYFGQTDSKAKNNFFLPNRRIFDGTTTKITDSPWAAKIFPIPFKDPKRGSKCGGSILSQYFLLTAGHCCPGGKTGSCYGYVAYGSEKEGTRFPILRMTIHPDYSSLKGLVINDVAIVEVKNPIKFSDKVKAISLRMKPGQSNEVATVYGWGRLRHKGAPSKILLHANVNVLSFKDCQKRTKFPAYTETTICSNGRACSGDSGGPLVIGQSQIGIVSGSLDPLALGCHDNRTTATYANIPHFKKFIDDITQNTAKWV